MSLQFAEHPSEADIMMAHLAERYLMDFNSNVGKMTDRELNTFFMQMFESAKEIGLETTIGQQAIPVTYNLFWSIWHAYTRDNTRTTPCEFQKHHRKYLIFSGASQAVMLMFGLAPSQVDLNHWNSSDRAYLSESLQRIAAAIGHDGQLLCPNPHFFYGWRRLIKLTNFADIIYAMPTIDYTVQLPELREYVRRLPEDQWLEAKKSLPSSLFSGSF